MKATIEKDELVIRIPVSKDPKASKSGKSLVLASTSGNVKPQGLTYKGKQVTIGLNAYVTADATE